MSPSVDVKEFLAGFLAESEEHLRAIANNLVALEESFGKGLSNPRAVRETFRAVHTLKGLSAMVGADPVVDIAHAMESVLRAADRAPGILTQAAMEPLVRGLRAMEERIAAMAQGAPLPAAPQALLEALDAFDTTHGPGVTAHAGELNLPPELLAKVGASERQALHEAAHEGKRAVRVDFVPSPELAAQGVNITAVRTRLSLIADIVKVIPTTMPSGGLAFVLLLATSASAEEVAKAAQRTPGDVQSVVAVPDHARAEEVEALPPVDSRRPAVRVDVQRLDDALERLSALVVTRFRLGRAVAELKAKGVDVRALGEIVAENGRQLRDLRGAIMRARMVRLTEVLERVPLMLRGLARSTGKPVHLELDAGETEVDKAVGDRIFPAVVHLIRNAVDHGIEPPRERAAAGKPEEGRIVVRCVDRGGAQLEVSVADDGRGIDAATVARAAGRDLPQSSAALLDLITLPGVSTRTEATVTSGRGLGMDIVRQVVDQLGGELFLETSPGAGTTFTLRIPLTITIVDAFSFLCAGSPYVVPVAMVEEILEVEPEKAVLSPGGQIQLLQRRGEAVPLVRLQQVLARPGESPAKRALLVRRNGQPFAFAVDRMLGQQEVVVRPLDDALVKAPGVAGATDLGDGRPTLVLDLLALTPAIGEVQA